MNARLDLALARSTDRLLYDLYGLRCTLARAAEIGEVLDMEHGRAYPEITMLLDRVHAEIQGIES